MILPLLFVVNVAQASPEPCKIAVLDMNAKALNGAEIEQVKALTDSLAQRIEAASSCSVVSPDDLRAVMDLEATKQACGAESSSCMAELGQALGVDEIVTGSVARIGAEVVVSMKRVNATDGNVTARSEQTLPDLAKLRAAALGAVDRLWGSSPPPSTGGSLLLGAGVGGGGVLVAAAGLTMAFIADGTLRDPKQTTQSKDGAYVLGFSGVGVAALGAAVAIAGGVVLATAE